MRGSNIQEKDLKVFNLSFHYCVLDQGKAINMKGKEPPGLTRLLCLTDNIYFRCPKPFLNSEGNMLIIKNILLSSFSELVKL